MSHYKSGSSLMLVPSSQVRGSSARGFQAAVAPSTSWSCNTGLEHSSVGFAGGVVAAARLCWWYCGS